MQEYKKLIVFDFDSTLIGSPEPEIGKQIYQDKTQTPWPYKGWWGRKESLDMDIFDIPKIDAIHNEYLKVKADETALVIMLTGRPKSLANEVEKILKAHGMTFDGYFYNDSHNTIEFKLRTIKTILDGFPTIEHLITYDDRLEHKEDFIKFGDSHKQITYSKHNFVVDGNIE
jgi:hypothetical protein